MRPQLDVADKRSQRINVKVKPALEQHLKALALKDGVGLSDLCRRIFVEYCKTHAL